MGRTLWLAMMISLFPLPAPADQSAHRTISQLVEGGFAIKERVGYRSLVLQRDQELYLCSVFIGVWGDGIWNTRCFPMD